MTDHAKTGGMRVRGGQLARLVEIPADAGAGMGLFENIHSFATPDLFARHLMSASRSYYGTALRGFLEYLVSHREIAVAEYKRCQDVLLSEARVAIGEVTRVAGRFALVAAAGELATTAGITTWKNGVSLSAATTCFKTWLRNRGFAAADADASVRQVRAFIEAHGSSRFEEGDPFGASAANDLNGSDALKNRVVNNRVGFIRRTKQEVEYCFFTESFRDQVASGYDIEMVLTELKRQGFLITDPERLTARRTPPGHDKPLRLYVVRSAILHGDRDL